MMGVANLERRRLDKDCDRLAEWKFAEEFPALARACLEISDAQKRLRDAAPHLQSPDSILDAMRGAWMKEGVPRARADMETIRRMHLVGMVEICLDLAASFAHEAAGGDGLRRFQQVGFRDLHKAHAKIPELRKLWRLFSTFGERKQ